MKRTPFVLAALAVACAALGNAAAQPSASGKALVDTTPPTVANAQPTEVAGGSDEYYSAGTLWFRPAGGGGSFTLAATAKDNESGIASVAFPDVSGTSGWTGSAGGTDKSAPYASPLTYTWAPGSAAPGAKVITATNGAGLTSTATITISADSSSPTGQTVRVNGGPWFAAASVPLTIVRGTDTGAGIDTTRDSVERAAAPLAGGICGTFGAFSAVTLVGGADSTAASGSCYRYQLKVTDNVGNVSAASAASTDAKVDTTPPPTPSLLFSGFSNAAASGSSVFYRPNATGSFTVTAVSADPESGTPSYSFPTVDGFTFVGTGASRRYSFSSGASAPLAPLTVSSTNASGLASGTASFTLVPDGSAPTVTVRCNRAPCLSSPYPGAVTVTITADDGQGSGVDLIRYAVGAAGAASDTGLEYTGAFTVSSPTKLNVRAWDRAGNASTPMQVTINSLADRLVFGAPARLSVRPAQRYLQARISSTKRARVVAVMTGRGVTSGRWWFRIGRGATIVQLRLPVKIRRPGAYSLRWNVIAGTKRAVKVTRVTLLR